MRIQSGTNRLVIIGKDYVYKLPILLNGVKANRQEYKLAQGNDLIAATSLHWYGIKQEKLNNIKIYERWIDSSKVLDEHKHLFRIKVNNRLQVGQDKNNKWKIFDYEDVKFYSL